MSNSYYQMLFRGTGWKFGIDSISERIDSVSRSYWMCHRELALIIYRRGRIRDLTAISSTVIDKNSTDIITTAA